MSDPLNTSPSSGDEVEPDAQDPQDPVNLQSAGDLDEDELAADPLEEGVEPAEGWSEVATSRPTPRQQREGNTLDGRLAAERTENDVAASPPLAETRMHELDESVDERAEAEVADSTTEEPVEAEHGAVLEGRQVEPTGVSAITREGNVENLSSSSDQSAQRAPEEEAERVEDSGR